MDSVHSTRNIMAAALKEMMQEKPLEKISVSDICRNCGMNRKSFYYYFRDKYDLVNWIFDRDINDMLSKSYEAESVNTQIENLRQFCVYLYENRAFYRKALRVRGQNSLSEHLREVGRPIIRQRIYHVAGKDYADDFAVDVIGDACILAIEKWLLQEDPMTPDELIGRITGIIRLSTGTLYREMELDK